MLSDIYLGLTNCVQRDKELIMQTFEIQRSPEKNLPVTLHKRGYLTIKPEILEELDLSKTEECRHKIHLNTDNTEKSLSFALEFIAHGKKPKNKNWKNNGIRTEITHSEMLDALRRHPDFDLIDVKRREENLPYDEIWGLTLNLDKLEYKVVGDILYIEIPFTLQNSIDFVVN